MMREYLFMHHEHIRFLIIGIVNTLFGYSLYVFFIFIGFLPIFAIIFSTILGIFFNFHSLGKYVFKQMNSIFLKKFVLVYFLLMMNNIVLEKLFFIFLHKHYFSGFFALCINACCSFILNKKIVFRT